MAEKEPTAHEAPMLPQRTRESKRGVNPGLVALAVFAFMTFLNRPSTSKSSPGLSHPAAQCPFQPEPLYPKIKWDMSEDEKTHSIDLYAQAVVSHPFPRSFLTEDSLINVEDTYREFR
jgi:hypothetical protein